MAQQPHILMFIDDDKHFLYLLQRVAGKIDSVKNTTTADNGANAIARLNQMLAEGEALPTIFFVDVNMPVMNGFEFLDAFQDLITEHPELKETVHLVMLTSSTDEKDKTLAMSKEIVNGYIIKESGTAMKAALEKVIREY